MLRVQQEMMDLRSESDRVLSENMNLKSLNEDLLKKLENEQIKNEHVLGLIPLHYSEIVEQFKDTAMSLQRLFILMRRIDDLEIQKQRNQDPDQSVIQS